jgi:hypothetical protein
MSDEDAMSRDALLRALNAYAKAHDLAYRWEARRGKGSHGRVYVGARFTTVPSGEIRMGTLSAVLKQLGIPKDDLK